MSVQLRGAGIVKNADGVETGTYTAIQYAGFAYDDTTSSNNDKEFRWNEIKEMYYRPPHKPLDEALEYCVFTCLEVDEHEKCKKWSWKSYSRSSKDSDWPTQPSATGTCERTIN